MEHRVIAHAQALAWLNNGMLAKHVASCEAFLEERRYAPQTRHNYLCCVAHFAHWMASAGLSVKQMASQQSTGSSGSIYRDVYVPVPCGVFTTRTEPRSSFFSKHCGRVAKSRNAKPRTISAGSSPGSISL